MSLSALLFAIAACLTTPLKQDSVTLRDPGFETYGPMSAWEATVYGAPATITPDPDIKHGGAQSIRVSAVDDSDAALGQEVVLRPRGWYRLSGWVRTRGLAPHRAPVCGTLQAQAAGGRAILARAPNHTGDTDWTSVALTFQAPADGRARICLFFVGFGRGTGTAWFDDISLEEVDPAMTAIRVTRDAACPGEISPNQYGQFIEYLCALVPSLWAERLYDGSFEGLSPYNFAYLKETDNKERPWVPSGATNRATYTLDPHDPVGGKVSQRIEAGGNTPCTVGISQGGIFVEPGKALRLCVWMRCKDVAGPVTVRLHGETRAYAACEFTPMGEWSKFTARLVPSGRDTDATLSIQFRGPGTLWLDSASLMPEDAVGGWRPDVVAAIRALKPGVIRFGGSVVDWPAYGDFDWRKTVGDPDRRPPFRSWGGLQPAGAGLEEIVQLIRAVGAEPILCIKFNNSTPEEAAAQVEYFNGAPGTPMGSMRARNGHPAPYGIRYWQIGNEIRSEEYDAKVASFARAMKCADPSIKLMASDCTLGTFRNAGALLDYACPHHYGCDNLPAMQASVDEVRSILAEAAPGRRIRMGITEWNTTAGDMGPRRAMLWTLANALACSRYHNLMHRNADIMEIACRSNLVDSFCSGSIVTDNHRLYRTPTYCAQQLYATLGGTKPLRLVSDAPTDVAPDISATLSADGKTLTVFAINDTTEEVQRTLDLSDLGRLGHAASVWTLADRKRAGEPDVTNSFGEPDRVKPVRSTVQAAPRLTYRFPALSLTVLQVKVDGARPK